MMSRNIILICILVLAAERIHGVDRIQRIERVQGAVRHITQQNEGLATIHNVRTQISIESNTQTMQTGPTPSSALPASIMLRSTPHIDKSQPKIVPARPLYKRNPGCKKLIWFTAVAAKPGTNEIPPSYKAFLTAAMMSAIRSAPSLVPHLIYDGPGDPDLTRWWKAMGGVVHYHHLSFFDDLKVVAHEHKSGWITLFGAYLRLDIPLILSNYTLPPDVHTDHVLYTDTDVMFMQDVNSCSFRSTSNIRLGPENERGQAANTGVMYINVEAFTREHEALLQHGRETRWAGLVDQTLILQYYKDGQHGGLQLLNDKYNWKGYWGKNDNAVIVHFHGPKPMRCLECFVMHSDNIEYCTKKYNPCKIYEAYWKDIMPDGGAYYTTLISKFYFLLGLATAPMT